MSQKFVSKNDQIETSFMEKIAKKHQNEFKNVQNRT